MSDVLLVHFVSAFGSCLLLLVFVETRNFLPPIHHCHILLFNFNFLGSNRAVCVLRSGDNSSNQSDNLTVSLLFRHRVSHNE